MSEHVMSGKMIRNNGFLKLKVVFKKLQKSLLVLAKRDSEEETEFPEDVKEGHFTVMATGGDKTKRFEVSLSYLTNPPFLRLLEQTAEEYGFNCCGALIFPSAGQAGEDSLRAMRKLYSRSHECSIPHLNEDQFL